MLSVTVITGIVTFVIVYFFRELDGPDDVIFKLRSLLVTYDVDGNPEGFSSKLISCYWCISTWVSFFVCLVSIVLYPPGLDSDIFVWFIFSWVASIGIAGVLYTIVDR